MNIELLVIQGRPTGKALVFGPGDHYLGRGPECQVRFNSDWVSRQHCLLRVRPDRAALRDLGSRNGTLINGALLDGERTLAVGDMLQIGPVVFEVRWTGPGPASAAAMVEPAEHEPATPEPPLSTTAEHRAVG